ncbi:hypothetical protein V501_05077, partial [Pseudogymnoascus sp. VKM F-4519 (FW-2642)]
STTNLRLNSKREGVPSAESRRVSIPSTQPQYGLANLYVMAPAPQNMNNYYLNYDPTIIGKPNISDGVNRQQPLFNVVHFAIYKSLATSPLYGAVVLLPISSGLYMPEMRQSVLPTFEFKNP